MHTHTNNADDSAMVDDHGATPCAAAPASTNDRAGESNAISRHAWLDARHPPSETLAYLDSLAAVARSSHANEEAAFDYLCSLAGMAGVMDFVARRERMVAAKGELPPAAALAGSLLQRADLAWIWLADATFVACLCHGENDGRRMESTRTLAAIVAKATGLRETEVRDYASHIATIATSADARRILDAIQSASTYGEGWKAIVDYRRIDFRPALRGLYEAMESVDRACEQARLVMAMTSERWNVLNCMSGFTEEGFEGMARRMVVNVNRRLRLAEFASFQRKVQTFVDHDTTSLTAARAIARAFGGPVAERISPTLTASADHDVRYANEQWHERMDRAYDALQARLDDHDQRLRDACGALDRIESGAW